MNVILRIPDNHVIGDPQHFNQSRVLSDFLSEDVLDWLVQYENPDNVVFYDARVPGLHIYLDEDDIVAFSLCVTK